MSQQSHTVEKWPQPSFLITWYLLLNKSPIFTGWYPPVTKQMSCLLYVSTVIILLQLSNYTSNQSVFQNLSSYGYISMRFVSDYKKLLKLVHVLIAKHVLLIFHYCTSTSLQVSQWFYFYTRLYQVKKVP